MKAHRRRNVPAYDLLEDQDFGPCPIQEQIDAANRARKEKAEDAMVDMAENHRLLSSVDRR